MMDAPEEFFACVSEAWWYGDMLSMNLLGVELRLIEGDSTDVLRDIVGA